MLDIFVVFLKFLVVGILHNFAHIVVNFIFDAENVIIWKVLSAEKLLVGRLNQLLLFEVVLGFVRFLALHDELSLVFVFGQPTVLEPWIGVVF